MRLPHTCTLVLFSTLLALTACGGQAAHSGIVPSGMLQARTASTKVDWPTWGFNRQRWSFNGSETTLSPKTVSGLKLVWTHTLKTRLVSTQPTVASNVQIPGGTAQTIVYVGDEKSNLYALNAGTGGLIWSKQLGLTTTSCGTASAGITSTPFIDRTTGRIYVLDGLAKLWAFDLGSGAQSAGFAPVQVYTGTQGNKATWSALNLSSDGSLVYLPTSSHSDTEGCGLFYGTMNSVNTMSRVVTTYQVVRTPSKYYGDGVWSWGGSSLDPDNGNVYAGVGNSWGSIGETGENSDSIIEFTKGLAFVADEQPESNLINDLDIGTTPVLYDNQGECAAFERKDGHFFTVNRTSLRNLAYQSKIGVGAQLGTPAYDPALGALYVAVLKGLTKLSVGPNCTAAMEWQTPISEAKMWASVPAVANGVVYVAGGASDNVLYAINAVTGAILWNSGSTISGPIVAEPTIVNGHVYVAAWDGHLYAFGL